MNESSKKNPKKIVLQPENFDIIQFSPDPLERAMHVIEELEREEAARLGKTFPPFAAGDTIAVRVRVSEGAASRTQLFEGVVIARRGRGVNESFIVRRTSSGEAMERTFQSCSPMVEEVKVIRHGDVRRAKLYHLRKLSGRAARIREKLGPKRETKPR